MKYLIIIVFVLLALFILYLISGLVVLSIINHRLFGCRTEDPDEPCYLTFEDYQDILDRKPFETYYYVRSIKGYIYQTKFREDFKGFVILSHGMFGTHVQYLMDIALLCSNGYRVLAFDNFGCGMSEGNETGSLAQGTYVLENVIEAVKTEKLNDGLPLFLYGHSWGGFSVLTAMRNYPEIKGVIARSSPYSQIRAGKCLIRNLAKKVYCIYGPFISLLSFFMLSYRTRISVLRGVRKNRKTPVLVLQSKNDPMVPYDVSAASFFLRHPKENVTVKVSDQGLHNTLIEEASSKAYLEAVSQYKEIQKIQDREERDSQTKEFISSLQKKKMYRYDESTCQEIIEFLDRNAKA